MQTIEVPNVVTGKVPTDPDVNKLIEKFGFPTEGTLITYQDIERVLNIPRKGNSRFNTVVNAWRARLYEQPQHILFECVPNVGFEVLPPNRRITKTSRRVRNCLRGVVRASDWARTTDAQRLSNDERRVRDHFVKVGATAQQMAALKMKRLAAPL